MADELLRLPSGAEAAIRTAGSGPPVLLLHGQPGSLADWEAVMAELGETVRAIACDRPGYGATRASARGIDGNAAFAAELLEALGGEPAVVVGHSWAGGVALRLARRHPGLVRGLVLAGSVGTRGSVGRLDRVLAAPVLGEFLSGGVLVTGAALVGLAPIRRRTPGLASLPEPAAPRIARELRSPRAWRAFVVEQRSLVAEIGALEDELARIETPARVLAGAEDRLVAPRAAEELSRRLPGAELDLVPGAGHVLPDEAPGAIARAVRSLLPATSGTQALLPG